MWFLLLEQLGEFLFSPSFSLPPPQIHCLHPKPHVLLCSHPILECWGHGHLQTSSHEEEIFLSWVFSELMSSNLFDFAASCYGEDHAFSTRGDDMSSMCKMQHSCCEEQSSIGEAKSLHMGGKPDNQPIRHVEVTVVQGPPWVQLFSFYMSDKSTPRALPHLMSHACSSGIFSRCANGVQWNSITIQEMLFTVTLIHILLWDQKSVL